jgi:site-specific DNA-methyltransferase (adenine-specific)
MRFTRRLPGGGVSGEGASAVLAPIPLTPENAWYTPPTINGLHFDPLLIEFWGRTALDPCAPAGGPHFLTVSRYYSIAEGNDGLLLPWDAPTVFCNPDYGRGIIDRWVEKAIGEHESGRAREIILLVGVRSDTGWWRSLRARGCPNIEIKGRVKFINPARPGDGPSFPSALFYLGPDVERFIEVFGVLGVPVGRIGRAA